MAGVRVLRSRLPIPLKIYMGLFIICLLAPLIVLIRRSDQVWAVLQIEAVGAVLLAIVYVGHAGYRIAYDEACLFMRGLNPWNRRLRWPTHAIALDNIAAIELHPSTGSPPASRYVPGEYLAIISERPGDEMIQIRPEWLHEDGMVELLVWLNQRRPGLMPEPVVDRLRDAGYPV